MRKLGHVKTKKPPGRPRKTTTSENRWIGQESKKDRFAAATAISKIANANLCIKISRYTISRRLNEINMNCRVACTKPYISKKSKITRLKFVTEHVKWTEERRDCVQFRNESKFNLFGCDGVRFVRRSPKERYSSQCTKSSVEFWGGSVMVFGLISVAGTGPLVKLHGDINVTICKYILRNIW